MKPRAAKSKLTSAARLPKRELAPPDYRSLVEAAGDMIYTLDLRGHYTYVNTAAEKVMGYSVAELIGQHFTFALTPESVEVALKHFRQGLARNESTPFFEVEAQRKKGGLVLLEIRAGGLYHDGVMTGRQGIARDISELRALQAEVAEKSQRVALLEERTRIAMSLYARIADLATSGTTDPVGSREALNEVHDAVLRVSAEKIGLATADLRILELLARGLSNREIAVELHRSPHTIKDHIARIMQRLGARRRAEAVATAINLKLISRAN
jgi:PAS domain S-box-containing protein